MKVLVAVDDSGFAEDLLRAVVAGIRHDHTEVVVLHVLQPVDTVHCACLLYTSCLDRFRHRPCRSLSHRK